MTPEREFDLLVVGGGINGAGIARDAAGRGLRVALAEQGDFGGATSSASTKLIHGGLRYLEHYELRLVAEALAEREVLLRLASHIARPLRFVMPHAAGLRPAWMIRAGLWLYDRLGGRTSLPRSESVRLTPDGYGAGLAPQFRHGHAYSDAWVDDARLVILNLRSALAHGAALMPRTRLIAARRHGGRWLATLEDVRSGVRFETAARVLVNAAGPWVGPVLEACGGSTAPAAVRLVKGSHIVVPRVHAGEHAYILQNDDRRVVFVIPYERAFSLIGTTDVAVSGMEEARAIGSEETRYLLAAVNRYLARPLGEPDVVWSYTGVRPLYDDGSSNPSETTRDYTLVVDERDGVAQLVVYGGKITTYRRLAESALARLSPWLKPRRPAWTHTEPLPGAVADRAAALAALHAQYPELPGTLLDTLFARHGALAAEVLGDARTPRALGRDFGGGLCEREVGWFIAHEWAATPDDVLWRRTKAGLHMGTAQRAAFAAWFGALEKAA
ncbi:MAG: glycerol-3-phosphate dehydrogenase [Burkholderiales bacterium]|nr:glycerol-3-phosphate dehydrogenase [Burkholderiales bacterium]OJX07821.1 MAG: glycerol-3-phosphate dehydrogenase [Burkholderiales bacterium 70-64]